MILLNGYNLIGISLPNHVILIKRYKMKSIKTKKKIIIFLFCNSTDFSISNILCTLAL